MKTLFLSFLLVGVVSAGVNYKNGNWYVSYTDMEVTGEGQKLEISRTYNSKSTSKGWFGFGWGNYFETKLVPSADGCVVVHEFGAGGKTRFCPKTTVDAGMAADKIIEAMRKTAPMTAKAAAEKKKYLMSNAEIRHTYAKTYNVKTKLAKGTKLFSNLRGRQSISVLKDGFKRESSNGKVEVFNDKGQLVSVTDRNKFKIDYSYKAGKLAKIKDSFGKSVGFEWNTAGFVSKLTGPGKREAIFKYDGNDLVYVKDFEDLEFAYTYDNKHNLTRITYNPNRKKSEKEIFMAVKYDPKTFFATEVRDRNGNVTEYKYGSNPKKPNDHYWTEVTRPGFDGKKVTNKYEYEINTRPDGSRYTYRIKTKINNLVTETIYNECCGLPLKISRGALVTNFKYDGSLLIEKKSNKGEDVKLSYHPTLKKVTMVNRNGKVSKFSYDKKGNLKTALAPDGTKVLLTYKGGKLSKMIDQRPGKEKRKLTLEYGALGKAEKISLSGVGSISLKYNGKGQIKEIVPNKKNPKIAFEVSETFQNLLGIIKPAGVNLSL